MREDATSRIFGFVDDLFFQAKIQETARKLNVKVEFVKPNRPDRTDQTQRRRKTFADHLRSEQQQREAALASFQS